MCEICFLKHTENEAGRLIPDVCQFFQKALHKVKVSNCSLVLITFHRPSLGHAIKSKVIKI